MENKQCMYCAKNEALNKIMLPVCDIDGFELYLLRNQAHRGRMVLAYNDHIGKLAEMDEKTCAAFFLAARKVARAMTKVFAPTQINLGMYADLLFHSHIHLVPKYEGCIDFGGVFQMNPMPEVFLSEEEYEAVAQAIKAALQEDMVN